MVDLSFNNLGAGAAMVLVELAERMAQVRADCVRR
jgi:hypothetical protein